jgi:hypothetical protein
MHSLSRFAGDSRLLLPQAISMHPVLPHVILPRRLLPQTVSAILLARE